jgi:mRNA interferase MazF
MMTFTALRRMKLKGVSVAPNATDPGAITKPCRGEVWRVTLDPTRGAEIQKTRPVVVLNPAPIGRTSLRIVVPVIGWKPHYNAVAWMIQIEPGASNGLTKSSAVDASQLRSVDVVRFIERIGIMDPTDLITVVEAAVLCLGYSSETPSSLPTSASAAPTPSRSP